MALNYRRVRAVCHQSADVVMGSSGTARRQAGKRPVTDHVSEGDMGTEKAPSRSTRPFLPRLKRHLRGVVDKHRVAALRSVCNVEHPHLVALFDDFFWKGRDDLWFFHSLTSKRCAT